MILSLKTVAAAALLVCLATSAIAMPSGRLTLAPGNAAPESDQISSTVYLTVTDGNVTELWDGTAWTTHTYSADLSLALTSSHVVGNYDVFEYWDGSALHICTGPPWASNISRGTGAGTTEIAIVDGRMVNAVSTTCINGTSNWTVPAHYGLLRGGFRAYVAGATADTGESRLLWDLFRPRLLPLKRLDSTASWTYGLDAFHQAHGLSANRLATFNGVAGRPTDIVATGYMLSSSTTPRIGYVGVGLDSTTTDNSIVNHPCAGANAFPILPCRAQYVGYPGMGYHEFNWLEKGAGTADVQTWLGAAIYQNGMVGTVLQ